LVPTGSNGVLKRSSSKDRESTTTGYETACTTRVIDKTPATGNVRTGRFIPLAITREPPRAGTKAGSKEVNANRATVMDAAENCWPFGEIRTDKLPTGAEGGRRKLAPLTTSPTAQDEPPVERDKFTEATITSPTRAR
jgi:hypothetical protein